MNFTGTSILAASLLMTVPLNTQAECNCPEPCDEPYMPCGYCEEAHEMMYSRAEIKTYLKEVQAYTLCLGTCIEEANSKAEIVIDKWNTAVEQYSLR